MKLTISTHAQKQITKLPKTSQLIIAGKIRKLTSATIPNEEKLKGYKNFFRVRVGSYRIVYAKSTKEVEIVLVGHRKDIYKKLTKFFK